VENPIPIFTKSKRRKGIKYEETITSVAIHDIVI